MPLTAQALSKRLRPWHLDWRWRYAQMASRVAEAPLPLADPATLAAVALLGVRKLDPVEMPTPGRVAAVDAARNFWEGRGEAAVRFEALLLAGEPVEAAAAQASLPPDVAFAYLSVFYDVSDRQPSELRALALPRSYGLIDPSDTETLVKLAAFTSGVAVFREVERHLRLPVPLTSVRLNRLSNAELDDREGWLVAREFILGLTLTSAACLEFFVLTAPSSEGRVVPSRSISAGFGSGSGAEAALVRRGQDRIRAERARRAAVRSVVEGRRL